jgi:hypothetical protein
MCVLVIRTALPINSCCSVIKQPTPVSSESEIGEKPRRKGCGRVCVDATGGAGSEEGIPPTQAGMQTSATTNRRVRTTFLFMLIFIFRIDFGLKYSQNYFTISTISHDPPPQANS